MIKQPKHDFFVWHRTGILQQLRITLGLILLLSGLQVSSPELQAGSRADLEQYVNLFDRVYYTREQWLTAAPDTIRPQAAIGVRKAFSLERDKWRDSLFTPEPEAFGGHGMESWGNYPEPSDLNDYSHVFRELLRATSADPAEAEELYYIAFGVNDSITVWPIACWPSSVTDFELSSCCDTLRVLDVETDQDFEDIRQPFLIHQTSRSFRPARGQYGTSVTKEVETIQVWNPRTYELLLHMPVFHEIRREGQIISGNLAGGAADSNVATSRNTVRTVLNYSFVDRILTIDSCTTFTSDGDSELVRSETSREFFGPKPGVYKLTNAGYALQPAEDDSNSND